MELSFCVCHLAWCVFMISWRILFVGGGGGSFITIENAPFYAAIESVCYVYEFAFYGL